MKTVPFVNTSVVTDMKWGEEGRMETALRCSLLLSLGLEAKLPQNHRKTSPEGSWEWVIVYSVSTHECWRNTAHTNRVAHVRLQRNLRREKADCYDNGWCEDASGLGSLVRWLSHYLYSQQRKTKYCRSSSTWRHFKPHLAAHILHNLANSVFTNNPRQNAQRAY